jgi:hypothetical protein
MRYRDSGEEVGMGLILWVIAAILVIVGIVQLIQGQIILAIVLFVVAAAIGPGGWSIFNRRA